MFAPWKVLDVSLLRKIACTFFGLLTTRYAIRHNRSRASALLSVESYALPPHPWIIGTYHHVSEAHLHRYLAEFDFRYNQRARLGIDDAQRMAKAAKGIVGKRFTYRRARRVEKAEDEIPF